jgi:DNA primase
LLHRFTNNVTILYDGDSAGIKAALRGMDMMLEEGINVKVVLLPEGEDPDSFARKHDASEVLAYIQHHQVDFIRFQTQLLNDDAVGDPIKRAEMVTQIVQSIAIIPDIIKRQIYIKDCANSLAIQESVLTRKVIELRKKYLDEQRKKRSNDAQHPMTPDTPSPDTESSSSTSAVELTTTLSAKEQNLQNLMQLIVRYGEVVLYQQGDCVIRVGEYIIQELHKDNFVLEKPLYQLVINEYVAHCKEPNWIAATYFQYHSNAELSQFAVDMLTDKYQLSRIYARQAVSENVVREVDLPSDLDILPELVQRLLLELKYTLVNERIDALQKMLEAAAHSGDWNLQRELLAQQPLLNNIRQNICKLLGNRVIVK